MIEQLPDACIDLTVTSPPYDDMDDDYNLIPTLRIYNGYHLNFARLAEQLRRVTKPGGVVVWVVGDPVIDGSETGTAFRQALYFKEVGFRLHDTMIYEKPDFSSPENVRYHQLFEYMFVLSIGKPKTFNPIKDKRNIWAGGTSLGTNTVRAKSGEMLDRKHRKVVREYGMRGNVWRMNTAAQERVCQPNEHPAKFPDALARDHIISWSNPGDVVLDPMCGSGTTLVQAKVLGRHYIGFDISEEYVALSNKRLDGIPRPLLSI